MVAVIIIIIIVVNVRRKYPRKRKIRTIEERPVKQLSKAVDDTKAVRQLERDRIKAERDRAKAEKLKEEIAQAKEDIPYYETQLERLYDMIENAKQDMIFYRQAVEHDLELNKYGGTVVKQKEVQAHIAARDKATQKVIKIENQIHAAEKRLNKAKSIINRPV